MRKIQEVLRLKYEVGLSTRQIAASVRIGETTVRAYQSRAERAGVGWPLPSGVDEAELERRLFPPPPSSRTESEPIPEWETVDRELRRRKGTTLRLLWLEYRHTAPTGYEYSWFCEHFRQWKGLQDPVMRFTHRAGERMWVDWAGETLGVIDPVTGEEWQAQIFVAVLGASSLTYAAAKRSQALPDWLTAHRQALEYFGGVPEWIVPDNTKTGVTRPDYYDPDINPSYADFARHYGTAIIPARVRTPRDKAKVEVGVQVVERWILAPLRNRIFHSLAELNSAICVLLECLNDRPMTRKGTSRRVLFEELDRPVLRPLSGEPYEHGDWRKCKVHIDYHVEVERHYYSVPYRYKGVRVEARFNERTVEIYHRGERIASHVRSMRIGHHTTVNEHMPESHRAYANTTPDWLVQCGERIGPHTADLVRRFLGESAVIFQGIRRTQGLLRLGKTYGEDRLEAAAALGLHIGATRVRTVESILRTGADKVPADVVEPTFPGLDHDHVRGPGYYL